MDKQYTRLMVSGLKGYEKIIIAYIFQYNYVRSICNDFIFDRMSPMLKFCGQEISILKAFVPFNYQYMFYSLYRRIQNIIYKNKK